MASYPITSWYIDVENVKRVSDFIFLGSKINADGDCNHKFKRHLLLGRIAMTNLRQCIKKQRQHFIIKRPHSQSNGFFSSHVWM